MKGHNFFPREDNNKIAKIHWRNFTIFFSRTTWPYGLIIALCKCVYWSVLFPRWAMWLMGLVFFTGNRWLNMSACWFILVAAMWGATNPFIKRGSRGIENIKENGKVRQFLMELKFLICNWKVYILWYYKSLARGKFSIFNQKFE